ncbi:hypothetical protein HQ529_03665 [Candidatus Woesearchaeota archaeon]|nr:hypothetical protein [Candidatus Woesearchaeota archaeon]
MNLKCIICSKDARVIYKGSTYCQTHWTGMKNKAVKDYEQNKSIEPRNPEPVPEPKDSEEDTPKLPKSNEGIKTTKQPIFPKKR